MFAIGHQMEVASTEASARQPDLIVHTPASMAAILNDGKLLRDGEPLPALVVEVASSSKTDQESRDRDHIEKRSEYAARGIPEYWIVDPDRSVVLVLTLTGGTYQETTFTGGQPIKFPAFPALALTAAQVLSAGG
jgi:Uma2 family endonuclease